MYHSSTKNKDLFVLQDSECPVCAKAANIRVSGERKRFLPWRATEYHGTCGSCFATFKLDKDHVKNLLRFNQREDVVNASGLVSSRRVEKVAAKSNFCSNCGASLGEGIRYCPNCGQRVS